MASEGRAEDRLAGELGFGREQVTQRWTVAVQVAQLDERAGGSPVDERWGPHPGRAPAQPAHRPHVFLAPLPARDRQPNVPGALPDATSSIPPGSERCC